MGATDDWLAQRGKINGAKTVTLTADDRTADEFAEHVNVGAALGVPPIVVGADPKAYKARLIQKGIADAVADAPKTAAWLKNREYGGLAKDDVENLSWFEKGLKDFGEMGDNPASRGVARGILQMGREPESHRRYSIRHCCGGHWEVATTVAARSDGCGRASLTTVRYSRRKWRVKRDTRPSSI